MITIKGFNITAAETVISESEDGFFEKIGKTSWFSNGKLIATERKVANTPSELTEKMNSAGLYGKAWTPLTDKSGVKRYEYRA